MPKVAIVGRDASIQNMFTKLGWKIVKYPEDADLVQFTGGEDVTPSYYKEERHPYTGCNPLRDDYEANVFHQAGGMPKAGICRGGQFLNVMSGGAMWQHVDHHAIWGTHPAKLLADNRIVNVTSTHHQMIRPSEEGEVLVVADLASQKETANSVRNIDKGKWEDVEVVWYPNTNSLCYQPHPEYVDENHECQELYFHLLEKYFGLHS